MFDLTTPVSSAGIGSRRTPPHVLDLMRRIAQRLAQDGHVLRSGAASGADSAFERGARDVGGRVELYLPWPGYNARDDAVVLGSPTLAAIELAERHHPAWNRCSGGARKLHGRNGHIALGLALDDPVALVVCYTPGASGSGGTGQALRIATEHDIPIYDLAAPGVEQDVRRWLHGAARSV